MLNPQTATIRLQRELAQLESATDDAIRSASALMTTMMIARADPAITHGTGQLAIAKLSSTLSSLVSASNDVTRVHRELKKVGIEVKMLPEEQDCPPSARTVTEVTQNFA